MKLRQFVKCKSDSYIDEYGNLKSKAEVTQEIKDKIEIWISQGSNTPEMLEEAAGYVLRDYNPYTENLQNKVNQAMSKLGLPKRGGYYI